MCVLCSFHHHRIWGGVSDSFNNYLGGDGQSKVLNTLEMLLWYEAYEDENSALPLERSSEAFMPENHSPN